MAGIIVYYVVSPVHVRNAQLLAAELAPHAIRLAYDGESPWLNAEGMGELPFESVELTAAEFSQEVWSGDVCGVVLSTAQPRAIPMQLVAAAMARGLPTIALEESNQIALNKGTVNNYVLPVDFVLAASDAERQGMIAAGFPARRFEVSGWPFYSGRVGKISSGQQRDRKVQLGLDPDRPVASLTLTGLHDAGESPAVRRRQLALAAEGLPADYQLVVKPHPIEKREILQPFVDECATRAHIVEGMVRVEEILEASDVLLNRGVSQVCIEALFQGVPVIVIDTEIRTPFHGLAEGLVVEHPEELGQALMRLTQAEDPMALYADFRRHHVPFAPEQARKNVCRRIAAICAGGERDTCSGRQWFDLALCQAWKADRQVALEMIQRPAVEEAGCPREALAQLFNCRASQDDLDKLIDFLGTGFQAEVLRCLWIDQLACCKQKITENDLVWIGQFPPDLDAVWFIPNARKWIFMLLRYGLQGRAVQQIQRMEERHIHVPGVAELIAEVNDYSSGVGGRIRVALWQEIRKIAGPLKRRLTNLLN
jgi:hypothetical protein